MKKSEMYHKAMLAVVKSLSIGGEEKLEIIEMLMSQKSLAEYCEGNEEKEASVCG